MCSVIKISLGVTYQFWLGWNQYSNLQTAAPQTSKSWCNNTMEAALCATSEVHAERVWQHAGVLTQPQLHSLGRRCIQTNYNTTCTICLMYYVRNWSEVSRAKVWGSERPKGSKSRVWDLDVWGEAVRRFEYQFQPSWNRYITPDSRLRPLGPLRPPHFGSRNLGSIMHIVLRTREVSTKLRSVTQYPLHG